jgi:ribosomal protein RSM22 (predicted rRNA methylase)
MSLPQDLAHGIEELTARVLPSELARGAAALAGAYRETQRARPQLDDVHRAAYLVTRLPATYAVLSRVLEETKLRVPGLRVTSMLDLGAGPGTAMWAVAKVFPELAQAVSIEDSTEWIAIGRELALKSQRESIRSAEWRRGSVAGPLPAGSFDLVTLSYLLNELRPSERPEVVRAAWQRTGKLLIIAEPGTPAGFEHVKWLRRELIADGAHMVAPCPHSGDCPMRGDDWCHFATRVQRSSEHRVAKKAELGYEDEKYSYVVFGREPIDLGGGRVLRHPRKHSGHVDFEVCTSEGLKPVTLSRKQGEKYKQARATEWGDLLNYE